MHDRAESATSERPFRTLTGGTETVLVVDDDDDLRGAVARTLTYLGYRVMQASTPESALRLVRMSNVHLVVIDVVLPMMSGLILGDSIRSIRPTARLMYMSGYTNEEILRELSEENPGIDFVPKPFTPELLAARTRSLLDRSLPPSSQGRTRRG